MLLPILLSYHKKPWKLFPSPVRLKFGCHPLTRKEMGRRGFICAIYTSFLPGGCRRLENSSCTFDYWGVQEDQAIKWCTAKIDWFKMTSLKIYSFVKSQNHGNVSKWTNQLCTVGAIKWWVRPHFDSSQKESGFGQGVAILWRAMSALLSFLYFPRSTPKKIST